MPDYILGISAYYHDSAACLLKDGVIVAAAQEERFSRKKHDPSFPANAVSFCLRQANINISQLTYIVFYDKPLLKFERLLETYLAYTPKGFKSFLRSMPVWLKEKLFLKITLKSELAKLAGVEVKNIPPLLFSEHHQSHAASAYYPSPFSEAAVICLDGVGEWNTTSVWLGHKNQLTPQWSIDFPHSLGLLYSAFTYYAGFKVNSGEYKLMGLAPYGQPKYVSQIKDKLIDIKDDGTFRLNMRYFNYATGLTMTNSDFDQLFGAPPRKAESAITQHEMDIARSIQVVTEEVVLKLANSVQKELQQENLCLAGGVALNCVANGRLLREGTFKNVWIQPAAGDAGGALGAAYSIWHEYMGNARETTENDRMQGAYLGSSYNNDEVTQYLDSIGADYKFLDDNDLYAEVAAIIEKENVVGWFQGKMEFGPRALGGRSIIGDPRSKKMQSLMNLKIKHRESFRPFAPAIKDNKVSDWFNIDRSSPYMSLVAPLNQDKAIKITEEQDKLFGIDKLNVIRSQIPAVTHVDYSARIQTVHKDTNPRFYNLIDSFESITDCPILINTSFNVRGEPIVESPEDAYRCFMRTEMDYLVMENILLEKTKQPKRDEYGDWRNEFELD